MGTTVLRQWKFIHTRPCGRRGHRRDQRRPSGSPGERLCNHPLDETHDPTSWLFILRGFAALQPRPPALS